MMTSINDKESIKQKDSAPIAEEMEDSRNDAHIDSHSDFLSTPTNKIQPTLGSAPKQRTMITGIKSLETLQEHKMEFNNQIMNTYQFEVSFPMYMVKEMVLGLIRTWNSVKRIAYSKLRSLAPPNRTEFCDMFSALTFGRHLNARHIRDAYSEAEWVISSQKEQLQYRIDSLKRQLAKIKMFYPKIQKPHKKRSYEKKMLDLRRNIAEFERRYQTDSFPQAIFGGRKLFRRLCKTNQHLEPEKHAQLKTEYLFRRRQQIFSRGERSRNGNENLRIIQGSKISKKDRKTHPFINMDLDAYYLAIRIPYLDIETGKTKSYWVYSKIYRKDITTFNWSLLQDISYSIRLRRKKHGSKANLLNQEGFEIHIGIHEALPALQYDFSNGTVGVDVNPPCTSMAFVSSDGNLTGRKTINHPELLYASANKRAYRIYEIAHEIVDVAQHQQKGIVIENLFFLQQTSSSKKWNRYVSNFTSRQLLEAIKRCAAKRGVPIRHVHPAYTSIIGRLKYMTHYQLTVHEAAAFVIGRRGLGIQKEHISRLFKNWLRNMKPSDNGKQYSTANQFSNRDLWKFLNQVWTKQFSPQVEVVPPRNAPLTPVSNVNINSPSNRTSSVNYTDQVRGITGQTEVENPDPPN